MKICICDLSSCTINRDDEQWTIFQGCWRSFHDKCLHGSPFCPICHRLLQHKANELGNTAKESILHPTVTTVAECDTNPDDESTMEDPPVINVQDIDNHIDVLSKKIGDFTPPPPQQNLFTTIATFMYSRQKRIPMKLMTKGETLHALVKSAVKCEKSNNMRDTYKRRSTKAQVVYIEFYYIWREHRAAIFEAILMAAICKIGSRLVPGYR